MTSVESKTYSFNADGEILGRLATKVALILRGKISPKFEPNAITFPGVVIVYNTDKLKFTGNKLEGKKYYWHSGYPGGIKERTLREFMERDSKEVFRMAVYGMLPKNKLRDKLIRKLKLIKGEIK